MHPKSDVLRVHLRKGEGGLMERSDIMVDQLGAIGNRRFLKRLGKIGSLNQKKLTRNIQIILD
jgi:mRNA interferase MazF